MIGPLGVTFKKADGPEMCGQVLKNPCANHTGSSEYLNYTFSELPVSMTYFIE